METLSGIRDQILQTIPRWDWFDEELCDKVCTVSLYAFSGAVVGSAMGFAAAGTTVVLVSGAVGGVIGAVAAFVLSLFEDRPFVKRSEFSFESIAKAFQDNPRVQESIKKIEEVVKQKLPRFDQSFRNHEFHCHVGLINDLVRFRPDLKPLWRTFVESLQGMKVLYPDGRVVPLDFSMELERLEGKPINFEVEELDPKSPHFNQDLKEIFAIEAECFSDQEHFQTVVNTNGVSIIFRHLHFKCYIARRTDTKAIAAFTWTREQDQLLTLTSVGRKAGASRLGVMQQIFNRIFAQDLSRFKQIELQVRKTNQSAINLYKANGFESVQNLPQYYKCPTEDAYLMRRK